MICGSHYFAPEQERIIRGYLDKLGDRKDSILSHLHCPPALPKSEDARFLMMQRKALTKLLSRLSETTVAVDALEKIAQAIGSESRVQDMKDRLYHECSMNHMGMMVACHAYGWRTRDYYDPGHPLQQAIGKLLAYYSGSNDLVRSMDGCTVPTWGGTLEEGVNIALNMATQPEFEPLLNAVKAHPTLIGNATTKGPDKTLDTLLTEHTHLFAKAGANGYFMIVDRLNHAAAIFCGVKDPDAQGLIILKALQKSGLLGGKQLKTIRRQAPRRYSYGNEIRRISFQLDGVNPGKFLKRVPKTEGERASYGHMVKKDAPASPITLQKPEQ